MRQPHDPAGNTAVRCLAKLTKFNKSALLANTAGLGWVRIPERPNAAETATLEAAMNRDSTTRRCDRKPRRVEPVESRRLRSLLAGGMIRKRTSQIDLVLL
jgi:hypothetical protein